jgi:hypothetical protein
MDSLTCMSPIRKLNLLNHRSSAKRSPRCRISTPTLVLVTVRVVDNALYNDRSEHFPCARALHHEPDHILLLDQQVPPMPALHNGVPRSISSKVDLCVAHLVAVMRLAAELLTARRERLFTHRVRPLRTFAALHAHRRVLVFMAVLQSVDVIFSWTGMLVIFVLARLEPVAKSKIGLCLPQNALESHASTTHKLIDEVGDLRRGSWEHMLDVGPPPEAIFVLLAKVVLDHLRADDNVP